MDYQFGYYIHFMLIIFIINIIGIFGQIERDIVLTPKLSLQFNGRSLFYKPFEEDVEQNSTEDENIPWEQTLKYVTYITLNNHINQQVNISDLPGFRKFLNSSYTKSNETIPKFGDIITIARGRLEKVSDDDYAFIEGQCGKTCGLETSNITAFWIVQKIRHRDPDRTFRYEIKFTVNPNTSERSDAKRDLTKRTSRAFILKDDDYPNSFRKFDKHVAQRRFDPTNYNEIFPPNNYIDHGYADTQFRQMPFPALNIGEYIPHSELINQNIQRNSVLGYRNPLPTTYHPNYHMKLLKPEHLVNSKSVKFPENINNHDPTNHNQIITAHLHHHYYVSDNDNIATRQHGGIIRGRQNDSLEREPIHTSFPKRIPYENMNLRPHGQLPHEYSVEMGSPIIEVPPPSSHQPYYKQQNDNLSNHPFRLPNSSTRTEQNPIYDNGPIQGHFSRFPEPRKPFIESPKYENVRYSDPDPLYENYNTNHNLESSTESDLAITHNFAYTQNSIDVSLSVPSESQMHTNDQIEGYESRNNRKPDSINAQLPPPDKGQDLTVPYVETSIITEKSTSPVVIITPKPLIDAVVSSTSKKQVSTRKKPSEYTVSSTENSPFEKRKRSKNKTSPSNKQKGFTTVTSNSVTTATVTEPTIDFSPTETVSTTNVPMPIITTGSNSSPTLNPMDSVDIKEIEEKPFTYGRVRASLTSTERPILKWKPKKTKQTKTSFSGTGLATAPETTISSIKAHARRNSALRNLRHKFDREQPRAHLNSTERVVTVLAEKPNVVQTRQSISSSVSVKVGNKTERRSLLV